MNAVYEELAWRIRGAIPDLDRVVQRALSAWEQAGKIANGQVFMDSVALNLHSFYSGLERLFELIARHIDGSLPTSETWHRDLLQQMAQDRVQVRPAVVGQDNALALDEFRRFRHLVRNVYTVNLDPAKMTGLLSVLPELWSELQPELLAFAEFVEDLGRTSRAIKR